jgi:hypothetical protein
VSTFVTALARAHHLAETDRRQVRRSVAHPAAHRGVERDLLDLHQHLVVAGLRRVGLVDIEVVGRGLTHGPLGEK